MARGSVSLCHRDRQGGHCPELLFLSPRTCGDDVRQRGPRCRRHSSACRHRPDRTSGPRRGRCRLYRLCRHAGLSVGPKEISVGTIFAEGTKVKDTYSGNVSIVSDGKVAIDSPFSIILLEKN